MQETARPKRPAQNVRSKQLGILVLDASPSMDEISAKGDASKADHLNDSVRNFFTRLKGSNQREQMYVSNVYFSIDAKQTMPITRADALDDTKSYHPFQQGVDSDGTDIGNGLKEALQVANEFLASDNPNNLPLSVVIIVMSDGESEETETLRIAKEINSNEKIKICASLFKGNREEPRATMLLQNIVQDPSNDYITTYDSETLRAFFERSLSSIVS